MFAVGIFMTRIGGLSWVAIQQLVDSVVKLVLLPMVGTSLDKINRNRGLVKSIAAYMLFHLIEISGMQLVLLFNNLSIVISACAFYMGETKFVADSGILRHVRSFLNRLIKFKKNNMILNIFE